MGKLIGSKPIMLPKVIAPVQTTPSPPPPPKLVQDYFKSEFYDPMAVGTQAIIPVKLPTGEEYKFVGGAPLAGFQEYLKSIDELPAAIMGEKEGKPEYRYPTFFEQREGSKVEPYITSEDILSKEAYRERLDPMSFLATLPSYVGVAKPPKIPRVPSPPRIENLSRFFDFLSPDFARRRSLLSESEAEERIPIGMKDGGRIGYEAGGVSIDVNSLPATATAAINQFGQDMFNALNLQQYYYPIGATGDADQGGRRPPAIAPVSTVTSPKPGTIGYRGPTPTPKAAPTPTATSKETLDFLATLPSAMNIPMPEVIRVSPPPLPRIPTIANFFDFLSPDFARRRSLLSEEEAEARTPIGMKDGGVMNLQMGGVPMEMDYRQSGGFVPLGVREKADDVPARLSKNEFVMTADAVRGMGEGDINKGAQRMYDIMNTYETIGRSLA